MRPRTLPLVVLLLVTAAACGGGSEPRAAGPLDEDAFAGEVAAVEGGTIDLSAFADQDLVVWFWSPW